MLFLPSFLVSQHQQHLIFLHPISFSFTSSSFPSFLPSWKKTFLKCCPLPRSIFCVIREAAVFIVSFITKYVQTCTHTHAHTEIKHSHYECCQSWEAEKGITSWSNGKAYTVYKGFPKLSICICTLELKSIGSMILMRVVSSLSCLPCLAYCWKNACRHVGYYRHTAHCSRRHFLTYCSCDFICCIVIPLSRCNGRVIDFSLILILMSSSLVFFSLRLFQVLHKRSIVLPLAKYCNRYDVDRFIDIVGKVSQYHFITS